MAKTLSVPKVLSEMPVRDIHHRYDLQLQMKQSEKEKERMCISTAPTTMGEEVMMFDEAECTLHYKCLGD